MDVVRVWVTAKFVICGDDVWLKSTNDVDQGACSHVRRNPIEAAVWHLGFEVAFRKTGIDKADPLVFSPKN